MSAVNNFQWDIIIAGSGPAGLSAAACAAGNGAKVLLLEKMPQYAVKMRASGGNRCNFTNNLPEPDFMEAFGRNGRFMSNALAVGGRDWLLEYMKKQGVKSVVAEEKFYFPASGRADDVIEAFRKPALAAGAVIRCGSAVAGIITGDGRVAGVKLANGEKLNCRTLILACGGAAAPALGGSDSGLKLAAEAGHRIVKMVPALAPLITDEKWSGELAGVSLADAVVTAGEGRRKKSSRNVLLFTKEGISGSAALNISGYIHRLLEENGGSISIKLNPAPEMNRGEWERVLGNAREKEHGRFLRSSLAAYFPHSVADIFCRNTVGSDFRNRDLSQNRIAMIAQYLSAVPLTVSRHGGFKQAMAADGGVSLKEINPATMESRIVSGLYFAGEIVDLTGPCGGFNIQFAIASGRLAAEAALTK